MGMKQKTKEIEFILRHQYLVRRIAASVYKRTPIWIEMQDLVAYGNIGLLDARRLFEPNRGHSFPAYASFRIRGEILDNLRRLSHCCFELSKGGKSKSGPIEAAECAENLYLRVGIEEDYKYDFLAHETLCKEIAELKKRERDVILFYYQQKKTFRAIGKELGCSKSWASRVHKRAIGKLRDRICDSMPLH